MDTCHLYSLISSTDVDLLYWWRWVDFGFVCPSDALVLLRAAHQLAWSAGVDWTMVCLVADVTLLHTSVLPAPALLLVHCRALSNWTEKQVAET